MSTSACLFSLRPRAGTFFILLFALAGTGAFTQAAPFWQAARLSEAPVLDGRLDDAAWEGVRPLTGFLQADPAPGSPPTEVTEVYVGFFGDTLYFAIRAFDSEPARIVATQQRHDAPLEDDDHIAIVLDTFSGRRNGYRFEVNALGARRDSLIEYGQLAQPDWDTPWEAVALIDNHGWTVEIALPLRGISFPEGVGEWGFNIERFLARANERSRWTNHNRVQPISNLAGTGRLTGIEAQRSGIGIEFKPYASLTTTRNRGQSATTRFKPGFDLFYKINSATTLVLTVNTDFADAEVDERQVNLTRFPVFFPEKRPFFLEDSNIFAFGGINRSPLPYFSRRIGIAPDGQPIDLLGGLKLTGRAGPVNYGLLNVVTKADRAFERENLAVARVEVNILEESSFGFIGTHGDPRAGESNQLAGLDFKYRTSTLPNDGVFEGFLWVQHSETSDRDRNGRAFGYEWEYWSRDWTAYSFWEQIEADYFPALGFVRQTGIWQGNIRVDRIFRPEKLRRVQPRLLVTTRRNLARSQREFLGFGPEVVIEAHSGDSILLRVRREEERLFAPFRVGQNTQVLPGEFAGFLFESTLATARTRPLSGSLTLRRKQYYGGHTETYAPSVVWRPSSMFNFEAGGEWNRVRLGYAQTRVNLIKFGGNVQFSPTLIWSNLAQYDNISESIGFNSRLRWTYASGSDIFLVLNQGIDTSDDSWSFTRTEVSAKVGARYAF
ncbi:MAG: carbohydrate binding family 9 domain-containing protein [Opitutales bacterium]|nr:carbohydrate binding family 9 domain-containing protein [Opitutales bacterium]